MIDYYRRADFNHGPLAGVHDAKNFLTWAQWVSDVAPPENVVRDKEGRRTLRIQLEGNHYYLKLHRGVGWREIGKNLLRGRLPVLGASNEYRALQVLHRIGVPTMTVAGYASRGYNPATLQSMIVTDALVGTVSLEEFCADWAQHPPPFKLRLRVIDALATTARRMHAAGVNHRDFYLCHFHIEPESFSRGSSSSYVIDLHRAQCHRTLPSRWRVKDLAGMYFSAMDCGLTQRDLLRFVRQYSDNSLRIVLNRPSGFWRKVSVKALRLYEKHNIRSAVETPHD